MQLVTDIVTTVCVGLLIGAELTVAVFINPVLLKLEPNAKARATSLFAARLGKAMPFWYALGCLLLGSETILRRHEAGEGWLVVATAIWATVIVLTIVFLVPINNRIARLDPSAFQEEAQREHKRWDTLHRWRVAALTVAMVCFLIASGR